MPQVRTQNIGPVQALAVDLIYYHPAIQEVTLRTAAMLCLAPAYPPGLGVRAVEVCAIMKLSGFWGADGDLS